MNRDATTTHNRVLMNPEYRETLENSRYTILNPSNQLKLAPDFFKTSSGRYTSLDPRLKDVLRGGYSMELNVPVYDATWKSFNRTQENRVEATVYPSYGDIHGGQVSYYTDKYLAQPYFSPNYQIRARIEPVVFTDPMGALKPHYDRVPIMTTPKYLSDYTFDQDQIGFREDIMALQSRTRDQQDYTKFHSNRQYFASY